MLLRWSRGWKIKMWGQVVFRWSAKKIELVLFWCEHLHCRFIPPSIYAFSFIHFKFKWHLFKTGTLVVSREQFFSFREPHCIASQQQRKRQGSWPCQSGDVRNHSILLGSAVILAILVAGPSSIKSQCIGTKAAFFLLPISSNLSRWKSSWRPRSTSGERIKKFGGEPALYVTAH